MRLFVYGLLFISAVAISIGYTYFLNKKEKAAYFYNQKVFTQFAGKQFLEGKLKAETEIHKQYLDSVMMLIQSGRKDLATLYQGSAQNFSTAEAELTEKYNSDIWKFINESVQEYGAKNDYDFIFGATGDGSLMYARKANDITDDIVTYINRRYQGQ
jgi:outer membrane protein